eukprot:Opistho-1_new@69583
MRRDLAFEHVDVAIGKELAQVIVGAAVAEPDLENRAGQGVDEGLQMVQAIALRLHARDETVETTHFSPAARCRLFMRPRQAAPLGRSRRCAQLLVGIFDAMRQLAHDLDGHLREFRDQAIEHVLGDLERGQRFACLDGGGAWHVAQDGDLAEEAVALHLGDHDLALVGVDQYVGDAAQDHVHRVAGVALVADLLARREVHALAGEGQQFQFRLLDLGKDRYTLQQLDFLVEVHRVLLDPLRRCHQLGIEPAPCRQVRRRPLGGNAPTLHDDDLLERFGLVRPVGDPHDAASVLRCRRQDVVTNAILRAAVEHGDRFVHHHELRPLDQRTSDAEFLPLRSRQTLAADADIVLQADVDHRIAQAELGQDFGDQGADPLARLRLAVDQAPEQDVVLQGGGAVVAAEIVELDGVVQARRQALGEGAPGPQDALLHVGIDQPQAMAGLDVTERQGHQARAVGLGHRLDAFAAQALQQQSDIGQLVGGDEAVLLEQRIVGRQAGEELDHGFGNRQTHALQVDVEIGGLQHRPDVGIGRDIVAIELLADRRTEQQVLCNRQVADVVVLVERLDQAGISAAFQPLVQGVTGLQDLLGEVGPRCGVDRTAQPE